MIFFVDGPGCDFQPRSRFALVVPAIGERYLNLWKQTALPSWNAYADRHELDIVVIVAPLSNTERDRARSITWQRCLTLSQPWSGHYDRIALTDADILIGNSAPSIFAEMDADRRKVGAVVLGDQFTEPQLWALLRRRGATGIGHREAAAAYAVHQRKYYLDENLPAYDIMISGGVLVMSPQQHRGLMEASYRHDGLDVVWEQSIMSHLILSHGLLQRLSPLWNFHLEDYLLIHYPYLAADDWPARRYLPEAGWRIDRPEFQSALATALHDSYFLHFARMSWLLEGMTIV